MSVTAGFNFSRGKIGNRGKAARVPGRDGFYEDGDRRTCERNRPPQDRQPAVTICSSRRARPKVTTDIMAEAVSVVASRNPANLSLCFFWLFLNE